MVMNLRDRRCLHVNAVGGKATNLHALLVAGLPTPEGFVISTQAYRAATDALAVRLKPLFARLRDQSLSSGEVAILAKQIREHVRLGEVPERLRGEVTDAYMDLGVQTPVAVRSSATAEDLADASFAGQHDSYLNVIGENALVTAIGDCWASLWSTRAVAYRREQGIDPAEVALAVVVQRMVDARSAGVMFTADPVTGCRTHTVIDSNGGLGESVVSGEVTPDQHILVSATGSVLQARLGQRGVEVRPRPDGGVSRETTTASGPVLTEPELRRLVALGQRAQALFGAPQDTEWAIDADGTAWLTQSRPVTTLYPLVQRASAAPEPGRRLFVCASLAQGLTRPITPLGRSAFKLITGGSARNFGFTVPDVRHGAPAYAEAGQRIFGDITAPMRNPVGRALALFALKYMETRSATALDRLHDDPDLRPASGPAAIVAGGVRAGIRMGRMLAVSHLPVHAFIALTNPDRAAARTRSTIAHLRSLPHLPPGADSTTRLDAVEELLSRRASLTMPALAGYAMPGFVALAAARALAVDVRAGDLEKVLRSLPNNVTTQMDLELWELSRQLRAQVTGARGADWSAPEPSTDQLTGFLERWGDRAIAEIDLGMPRWREEPEHLLGVLRNYARLGETGQAGAVAAGAVESMAAEPGGKAATTARNVMDPAAQFEAGARQAHETITELLARTRNPLRRIALALALDRARRLIGLRESPKLGLVTVLARSREQFLTIGEELAAAGLLESARDVAFLDVIQLRAAIEGADMRTHVTAARAEYEAELRRRHIPRLLLSDGTEVEALASSDTADCARDGAAPGAGAAATDPHTLRGTPASSGTVTAVVRVITDPVGAHVEPGEILVAPSTDPGWTPLFLTAGGLVMEMGGANSHGAVVAREYGIPAVVGVAGACTRLRTGQHVSLDGSSGTVKLDSGKSTQLDEDA